MPQKTISLPEAVYMKLKGKKRENETFPDLLLRLMNESEVKSEPQPIEAFFGAFEDESGEWEEIETRIYAAREKSRSRKPPRMQ